MSGLKCLKVAFLPSLFMLQVPVRPGVAGGAGLPGRAPLLGGQRAAARAGHQSGAHHIAVILTLTGGAHLSCEQEDAGTGKRAEHKMRLNVL